MSHALLAAMLSLASTTIADDAPQAPAAPAAPVAPVADTARFGLTISGGVSLGAYEAGLNWSLVRLLKRFRNGGLKAELARTLGVPDASMLPGPDKTELVAVTGASAGNINAFITAASWCQKEGEVIFGKPETSTNNAFFHLWSDIGIAKLFPQQTCDEYRAGAIPEACREKNDDPLCAAVHLECATPDRAYAKDDGLMTRAAFASSIYDLEKWFTDASFPDCNFPVGVTLTRVHPHDAALEGVVIPVQRNAVTLRARSAGARGLKLVLHEGYMPTDPTADTVSTAAGEIFIPKSAPDGTLALSDVVRIVQAASAFPVAFGPIELESRSGVRAAFLDGGVFDNIPLGLLIDLQKKEGALDAGEIYLLPMNLRATPERLALKAPRAAANGLSEQVAFLGGAVSVALNYELAFVQRERMAATREGEPTPFPVLVTSRYSQIFGSPVAYFGAFFSRELRAHDYYVGIYDGLYSSSYEICSRALFPQRTSFESARGGDKAAMRGCVAMVLPAARDAVLTSENGDDVDARYAVNRLLCSEFLPRDDGGTLEALQGFGGGMAPRGIVAACRAAGRVVDNNDDDDDDDDDGDDENNERWQRVAGVSEALQGLMDVNAEIMEEASAIVDTIAPPLARWLRAHDFDVQRLAPLLETDASCVRSIEGCTRKNADALRASFRAVSATLQAFQADSFRLMMGKLEGTGTKAWFERCRDGRVAQGERPRTTWERAECSDVVDLANDYEGYWARFARDAMFRLEEAESSIQGARRTNIGPMAPHGVVAAIDFGLRTLDQVNGTAARRDGYWTNTSTASLHTLPGRLAAFALPSYVGLDVGVLGAEAGYRPFAWRPWGWLSMSPGLDAGVRARPGLDVDVAPTLSAQLRGGAASVELGWRPFIAYRKDAWLASPVGVEAAFVLLDKARVGVRFADPGSIAPVFFPARGQHATFDDVTIYLALSDVGGLVYWLPNVFRS